MTNNTDGAALLPVTQADRRAAADAFDRDGGYLWGELFKGNLDDDHRVQAFARHRISHSIPGGVGMLAQAAAALNVATDGMEQLRPQRQAVLAALAALTPSALSGDAP